MFLPADPGVAGKLATIFREPLSELKTCKPIPIVRVPGTKKRAAILKKMVSFPGKEVSVPT
jgi:hypothetical protein